MTCRCYRHDPRSRRLLWVIFWSLILIGLAVQHWRITVAILLPVALLCAVGWALERSDA